MPRGPAPTPTATLKLRGSRRATRDGRKREPQPDPRAPACPTYLDGKAKRVWAQLMKDMHGMRVLTRADRNALARYCSVYAEWVEVTKVVRSGDCTPGERSWMLKGADTLGRLEQQFGLTPASRTRLQTIDDDDATESLKDKYRKKA